MVVEGTLHTTRGGGSSHQHNPGTNSSTYNRDLPACRHIYWSNSDTNIIGITKHCFKVEFKAHAIRQNSCLPPSKVVKNLRPDLCHGSRGKPTIILLKEHNNTIIPNNVSSTHRWVSPSLSSLREASFCSRWWLTQRPTTGRCADWEVMEHWVLSRMSLLKPFLKVQRSVQKKRL